VAAPGAGFVLTAGRSRECLRTGDTDQGAFNAATSGVTSYGFEGISAVFPPGYVQGNITVGGVTFTGGNGLGFVFDANAGFGNYGASFFSGQSQNVGVDPSEVVCTSRALRHWASPSVTTPTMPAIPSP
jgi:hypothetical protein